MDRRPLHCRDSLLHLRARPGYDEPVLPKQAAHQPPTRYLVILPSSFGLVPYFFTRTAHAVVPQHLVLG